MPECGVHSPYVTSLDLSYEAGRIVFSQWPPLVTSYIDAAVRHYKQKWELPEILTNMGVSNETMIDLKELRTNATIGLLTFASYSQSKAHDLVHGGSTAPWLQASLSAYVLQYLYYAKFLFMRLKCSFSR